MASSTGSSRPATSRTKYTTSPRSPSGSASHSSWVICSLRAPRVSVMVMRMTSTSRPVQLGSALPMDSRFAIRPDTSAGNKPLVRSLSNAKIRWSLLTPSKGAKIENLSLLSSRTKGNCFFSKNSRNLRKGSPSCSSTNCSLSRSSGTTLPRCTSIHQSPIGSSGFGSQNVVGSPSRMLGAKCGLEPTRLTPGRTM